MPATAIVSLLIAALLIAGAGPAVAKKQNAEPVYQTQKQATKKSKGQAGKDCHLSAPPFMYNPRFMNRGFFKRKCREPSQ